MSEEWKESDGDLIITETQSTTFYLHLKGFNAANQSSAASTLMVGPFKIDVNPPEPAISQILDIQRSTDSLTWKSALVTDPVGAGVDPNAVYGWKFGNGP